MKYYFGDNRQYGAEDIKKALSTFVAEGGIALNLSDSVEYDISELNNIICSAVMEGVVPETNSSLRLINDGGRYVLGKGRAIFSDGGIADVEEDTEIEIDGGQYLYIAYSMALDDVYFLTSSQPQQQQNGTLLVPIAYVEYNGAVRDMRNFAKGKVPAMASIKWNTIHEEELTVNASSISGIGYIEMEHEVSGDFNFMMIQRNRLISVLDIGDDGKVSYNSVWHGGSDECGYNNNAMVVKLSGSSQVRATLLEKDHRRIRMRYYIPSRNMRDFTYKVWLGIKMSA